MVVMWGSRLVKVTAAKMALMMAAMMVRSLVGDLAEKMGQGMVVDLVMMKDEMTEFEMALTMVLMSGSHLDKTRAIRKESMMDSELAD